MLYQLDTLDECSVQAPGFVATVDGQEVPTQLRPSQLWTGTVNATPPSAAPDVLEPVHICDIATQLEYSLPRQKAASLVQRHRARSACDAAIHTLHLVETTDSRSRDCEKKAPGVDSDSDSRRQVWTATRTRYNDGSLECRNECPNDFDRRFMVCVVAEK
jgi:hypothetical protein